MPLVIVKRYIILILINILLAKHVRSLEWHRVIDLMEQVQALETKSSTSACESHIRQYIEGLKNKSVWAFQSKCLFDCA